MALTVPFNAHITVSKYHWAGVDYLSGLRVPLSIFKDYPEYGVIRQEWMGGSLDVQVLGGGCIVLKNWQLLL